MTEINRRTALKLVAVAPFAASLTWTGVDVDKARRAATAARAGLRPDQSYEPQFFTEREWELVHVLADMIIPADERSGSATDAGTPEFIDFMMMDGDDTDRQIAMRGGLAWLDTECRQRFDLDFLDCTTEQREAVLDDIAWPDRAAPELSHGAEFFCRFRDLVATGFWSSRIGIDDLEYLGNQAVPEWTGCPPEALERFGVQYTD
jgi:gluconate 2-dehydrogenase gamma chain